MFDHINRSSGTNVAISIGSLSESFGPSRLSTGHHDVPGNKRSAGANGKPPFDAESKK